MSRNHTCWQFIHLGETLVSHFLTIWPQKYNPLQKHHVWNRSCIIYQFWLFLKRGVCLSYEQVVWQLNNTVHNLSRFFQNSGVIYRSSFLIQRKYKKHNFFVDLGCFKTQEDFDCFCSEYHKHVVVELFENFSVCLQNCKTIWNINCQIL